MNQKQEKIKRKLLGLISGIDGDSGGSLRESRSDKVSIRGSERNSKRGSNGRCLKGSERRNIRGSRESYSSSLIAVLILVLSIVLISSNVYANVIFNQVLYDPIKTESGGEAIQIYNNGNKTINLNKWVIETESSKRDVVFSNKEILPGNYFLISDTNWNQKKDNATWQNADLETTITMKNSNSFIRLFDANGTMVDSLCWGNLSNSNFTNCASPVKSGYSLLRQSHNGFNSEDYVSVLAEFFNLQIQSTQTISLNLNLQKNLFSINDVQVKIQDDDALRTGIQISPNPGNIREVDIELNQNVSVFWGGLELKVLFENFTYYTKLNLDYYLSAGKKQITIKTKETNESKNISFEYLPVSAISLDSNKLEMTNLKLIGDYDFTSKNSPTIKNMGNTPVKIAIKATDFIFEEQKIPVSNLYFKIGKEEKQARRLSDLYTPILDIGETIPFGIIFKSKKIQKGNYQGLISIMGVSP